MSTPVIPDEIMVEFWEIVRDCLRAFHKMTMEGARRKISKVRKGIESLTESQIELFYHSEPFDVACEIARHPLNVEPYLDRYLQIRDAKHGNGISKQVVRKRNKSIKGA
jgi:hypothetical protein